MGDANKKDSERITFERAQDILKANGIESQEELTRALADNALNIGMFTMPFKKEIQ